MSKITPLDYQGQAVAFNAEGWINATEAAARFGKRPTDWLALDGTRDYMDAMASALGQESKVSQNHFGLARTSRGGKAPGTWFHPKLAVRFAQWLDMKFAVWCDLQIDGLIRGDLSTWRQVRQQSAVGYRGLCDALALTFEASGKTPQRHHFMNEARLINEVITGSFTGRNRDQLTEAELVLMTLVEVRDVLLMGQGKDFATRKAELLRYVQALQFKQVGGKAA
jgi:hypothetical protein